MKNDIKLFLEFKFFSLRIIFFSIIKSLIEIFTVKTIKYRDKKIKFLTTSKMTIARAHLFGIKEKEVYEFIDRYLGENDTFVDIGANVGVFSIFSCIFKKAKCIAFEPEFSNLYLFKQNIILNNLITKIDVYPCSVSDHNSLNFLHLSSLESGEALHSISKKNIEYTDEKGKVVMRTGTYNISLDEFFYHNKANPVMLKIDTDGKELEILNGAVETLKKLKYIALEIPLEIDKKNKCLEILDKNNFKELKDLQKDRNLFFAKKNDYEFKEKS